jgi:hypothetical protein
MFPIHLVLVLVLAALLVAGLAGVVRSRNVGLPLGASLFAALGCLAAGVLALR